MCVCVCVSTVASLGPTRPAGAGQAEGTLRKVCRGLDVSMFGSDRCLERRGEEEKKTTTVDWLLIFCCLGTGQECFRGVKY